MPADPTSAAERRDALPGLPDPVLAVLACEVTPQDCYAAAEAGGYEVATLVDLAARIVLRELHGGVDLEGLYRDAYRTGRMHASARPVDRRRTQPPAEPEPLTPAGIE